MTDKEKLDLTLYALRLIALSYRERIDRRDTPPYVLAQEMLEYLGEQLEHIPTSDPSNEFWRWRAKRQDDNEPAGR